MLSFSSRQSEVNFVVNNTKKNEIIRNNFTLINLLF